MSRIACPCPLSPIQPLALRYGVCRYEGIRMRKGPRPILSLLCRCSATAEQSPSPIVLESFFLAFGRVPTGGSGPSETIAAQVFSPPCSPLRCLRSAPRAQGFALTKNLTAPVVRCAAALAGSGARTPPETVRRRKEEWSSATL